MNEIDHWFLEAELARHYEEQYTKTVTSKKNPMKETEYYWYYAMDETNTATKPDKNAIPVLSGKWMLFIPENKLKKAWKKVRKATKHGLLGHCSKCSTARENSLSSNDITKLICVYTYDYKDELDVYRVRNALRDLDFDQKLYYKSDEDTINGVYGHCSKYAL